MDRASLDPKALSGQKPERSALHRCRYRVGCECGTRRFGSFANRGGAWLYRVRDRPKAEHESASIVQRWSVGPSLTAIGRARGADRGVACEACAGRYYGRAMRSARIAASACAPAYGPAVVCASWNSFEGFPRPPGGLVGAEMKQRQVIQRL